MRNIIVLNDNKFKSVFVGVNMFLPLDGKTNSKNALLAKILKKGSSLYKTEKELEIALAKLYDTKIDVNLEKIDNMYNICFGMELLNIKYMSNEEINKAKEILVSLVCTPNFENGLFNSDLFEREKESLIEKIKEEKDDKKKYALKGLEKDMFKGTAYETSILGNIEDVQEITNEQLVHHYSYIVKNAKIVITANGNLDGMESFPKDIYEKITEVFNGSFDSYDTNKDILNTELIEKEEMQDIAQSILTVGLKGKLERNDVYKAVLFNTILGGTPASKLFQNVREKESLAYFAKSKYDRFKNVIEIFAGVDPKNNDKAKKVILDQVELIKNGDITDVEFNAAKQSLISSYKELKDSKEGTIRMILNNELFFNKQVMLEDMILGFEKVTKEDVIEVANRFFVTNIFLLGGKSNV